MANYESIKYNFDGANLTGVEGVPTGTIVPWTDSSIPSGFLECDGSNVSRTTYADLFAVIGTTYGVGDGATTFGLPDLQDNVPVGKSNNKALASTGGANTVTPTGSTANATLSESQLASHTHNVIKQTGHSNINRGPLLTYNTQYTANSSSGSTGSGSGHSHNMSMDATSTLQPYIALIYVIKT